jgi:signal transduction histidine kinase
VDVSVQVADGHVRAQVRDDGIGPGVGTRDGGHGLPNLSRRAASLGGFVTIGPGADAKGTVLTWEVPLPGSESAGTAHG